MLHVTAVSVVFVTVTARVWELPRRTEPLVGETVTAIEGGGGGGAVPVLPPPQPSRHTLAASIMKEGNGASLARGRLTVRCILLVAFCVGGRM